MNIRGEIPLTLIGGGLGAFVGLTLGVLVGFYCEQESMCEVNRIHLRCVQRNKIHSYHGGHTTWRFCGTCNAQRRR